MSEIVSAIFSSEGQNSLPFSEIKKSLINNEDNMLDNKHENKANFNIINLY